MCYLGMCALWSLDVGKGGGVLRFCVFLGMWYLGMCALWSQDVGKEGGSAGGGGAGGFHFHQSSARVRRSPTEGELACLLLLM